jgi:hypothetical protein
MPNRSIPSTGGQHYCFLGGKQISKHMQRSVPSRSQYNINPNHSNLIYRKLSEGKSCKSETYNYVINTQILDPNISRWNINADGETSSIQ